MVIENIRSISRVNIPLKRINILIGDNSSGKSSILFALLALNKMSVGTSNATRSFQDFGWLKRKQSKEPMRVCLRGEVEFGERKAYTLDVNFFSNQIYDWSFKAEKPNLTERCLSGSKTQIDSFKTLDNTEDSIKRRIEGIFEKSDFIKLCILYDNDYKIIQGVEQDSRLLDNWINYDYALFSEKFGEEFQIARDKFSNYVNNLEFIPVSRGSFSVDSPQSDSRPAHISHGDSAPHEFLNMMIYPDYIQTNNIEDIVKWAAKFDIERFEVVIQPGRKVEGRGWLKKGGSKLPIALYGFGSNQFIHLAAKCIFASDYAPILIEEPEIHLHPEKQALVMDFLIERMKQNHQLFISTHSEHLIGRIQRRVVEQDGEFKIDSDDVAILWVRYDEETSSTLVDQILIDENGIFHEDLDTYLKFNEREMSAISEARRKRQQESR